MIPNRLKQIWASGQPALNGWCSIGNSFTAEIMAAQGFDSVTVDMQHGALDYSHLLPMFQAMRASGATLMARVPWNEPGVIMKALDAGAYGIICPMINTAEEAARFVSYLRYPPLGQRSYGPTRVSFAAGAHYAAEANGEILEVGRRPHHHGVVLRIELHGERNFLRHLPDRFLVTRQRVEDAVGGNRRAQGLHVPRMNRGALMLHGTAVAHSAATIGATRLFSSSRSSHSFCHSDGWLERFT